MNGAFYIYGAGIVATGIYTAIKKMYECVPIAFLVSCSDGNPSEIEGIPVLEMSCIDVSERSNKYLIATPEIHHAAIVHNLCQFGIQKEQLICVDNRLENKLMEAYYSSLHDFSTVFELLNAGQSKNISNTYMIDVFQAKCHVDKPLNNLSPIPAYIKPIQVGAALTKEVIASIKDNAGDNISERNRNYCELTATYYGWKNSQAVYKGLCHYRRIFDISDEQLKALIAEHKEVDVILPYPSIHYPDISGQHNRYVRNQDWSAMLQALKEVAPHYYDAYVTEISKENYFYNYNMLIAKKEVFDDYCQFLFSVLKRTEELTTPRGWERADRFVGYLGENLTTLYFRKNRTKLNIIHSGKIWFT